MGRETHVLFVFLALFANPVKEMEKRFLSLDMQLCIGYN
nr:MAG TPA: hypothetical protein [Caudoviricetes sp.]